MPWFRATDNFRNHLVDVHEPLNQEFLPVALLPVRDNIQKESILDNADGILIAWLEEVFRHEILFNNGLDIFFCKKSFRADVYFVS